MGLPKDMLEIRTGKSERKGIRVDLFRRYRIIDEATKKGSYKYKRLGSFLLNEGFDPKLAALLDSDELIDLENWLAEVAFAKQFNVEPDDLEKINVHLPTQFYAALKKLSLEAKRANLSFTPNQAILENLLKTSKLVQNKIDKINGFASNILEDIGISAEIETKKIEVGDKVLFRALLDLRQPIGQTCSELEEEALKLGKNKKISPPIIKEWAGLMPGRNLEKKVNNWCYYIAGEVLLKHGMNPCKIIPAEHFAVYWTAIKKLTLTKNEAVKEFLKVFRIPSIHEIAIKQAFNPIYQNGI